MFLKREFDDSRSVGQAAAVIDDRTVDQGHSAPGRLAAIAPMNMAEDVQPGLDAEQGTKQVLAAHVFSKNMRFVERAKRRFVGDEHIRIVGNEIPVFANLHQTLSRECPVATNRVDGRSPEVQPFEGDPGVLEVGCL